MATRSYALDRRHFIKGAGAASVLLAGLGARLASGASGRPVRAASAGNGAYGPLAPVADAQDGIVRLALPEGFSYVTLGIGGSIMADRNATPHAHDGMAAFPTPDGRVRLVRNHEQRDVPPGAAAFGDLARACDPLGPAGCTTVEIEVGRDVVPRVVRSREHQRDPHELRGRADAVALVAACEETVVGLRAGFARPHGYVFEVPAAADDEVRPRRSRGWAASRTRRSPSIPRPGSSTRPRTGAPGGVYRFVPERYGDLLAGRLQMLAAKGRPPVDARTGQHVRAAGGAASRCSSRARAEATRGWGRCGSTGPSARPTA